MNAEQISAAIRASIDEIAPELEAESLETDASFRNELEIDSMDFLNIVEQIHSRTGLAIPESDYASLDSIAQLQTYLEENL